MDGLSTAVERALPKRMACSDPRCKPPDPGRNQFFVSALECYN
jgi:hypothetical protein